MMLLRFLYTYYTYHSLIHSLPYIYLIIPTIYTPLYTLSLIPPLYTIHCRGKMWFGVRINSRIMSTSIISLFTGPRYVTGPMLY